MKNHVLWTCMEIYINCYWSTRIYRPTWPIWDKHHRTGGRWSILDSPKQWGRLVYQSSPWTKHMKFLDKFSLQKSNIYPLPWINVLGPCMWIYPRWMKWDEMGRNTAFTCKMRTNKREAKENLMSYPSPAQNEFVLEVVIHPPKGGVWTSKTT